MKRTCRECGPAIGKRRASRVRQRLEAGTTSASGRKKAIIYTIFTIPPALRSRCRDRKEWRKLVKKAWLVLKNHYGAEYALECSHPVGDKSTEFHPHANFLWVQRDGFKPFIDVALLRKLWQAVLETYGTVDIWTSYQSPKATEKERKHRYRYVTRIFHEYTSWIGSMRWYGKYPKVRYHEEPKTCPRCHEVYLFMGRASEVEYNQQEKVGAT